MMSHLSIFLRIMQALVVSMSFFCHAIFVAADEPLAKIEGDMPEALRELVLEVMGTVEEPATSVAQARRRRQTLCPSMNAMHLKTVI